MTVEEEGASRESLERKACSEARLAREGVPFIEHLPAIEDEAAARPRSVDEIVDRGIALLCVAGAGEGAPDLLLERFVKEFHAESKLSPNERAFIQRPSDRLRAQFSWRYEALLVLLWALSFFDELPAPSSQTDPALVGGVLLKRGEEKLRTEARLRTLAEILDEADIIYRYHWAVRNAGFVGGSLPVGLDSDVVMERHHALNWLIGCDDDWDDVRTDT